MPGFSISACHDRSQGKKGMQRLDVITERFSLEALPLRIPACSNPTGYPSYLSLSDLKRAQRMILKPKHSRSKDHARVAKVATKGNLR